MAHRAVAIALAGAGLFALPFRPLISLILFGASLVIVLDRRGAFGSGAFRGAIAFMTGLWLGLIGVAASLLGMIATDPGGNFLLVPGLLLVAISVGLLAWSLLAIRRARRGGFKIDA
jgi:hypothetical protein